jgi:hypothetical protein
MILFAILITVGAAAWTVAVLFANSMRSTPGGHRKDFVGLNTIYISWLLVVLFWAATIMERRARAAELWLPPALIDRNLTPPPTIMREESTALGAFGTYSTNYMQRRWARLCKGGGRYQAMAEAYERGRPNPCR